MIPKNSRYCAILLASAPFGQHKVITEYGRELANKVAADYQDLKSELAHHFGKEFAVKAGAFQAAVATANLAFDGLGYLSTDARLGTVSPTRQPASLSLIHDAFLYSGCRLAVICGQKSAFMQMVGVLPELIELRSCQSLLVYLDQDGKLVGTQVFAPVATVVWRNGWRRRVNVAAIQKFLVAA